MRILQLQNVYHLLNAANFYDLSELLRIEEIHWDVNTNYKSWFTAEDFKTQYVKCFYKRPTITRNNSISHIT